MVNRDFVLMAGAAWIVRSEQNIDRIIRDREREAYAKIGVDSVLSTLSLSSRGRCFTRT